MSNSGLSVIIYAKPGCFKTARHVHYKRLPVMGLYRNCILLQPPAVIVILPFQV